jgi:hypothetical protein
LVEASSASAFRSSPFSVPLVCIMSAKKLLVALAAGILSQCAVASFRLRETSLDIGQMLLKTDNSINPVYPDGHHGPKRLAGFFKLNRTEVSATSRVH